MLRADAGCQCHARRSGIRGGCRLEPAARRREGRGGRRTGTGPGRPPSPGTARARDPCSTCAQSCGPRALLRGGGEGASAGERGGEVGEGEEDAHCGGKAVELRAVGTISSCRTRGKRERGRTGPRRRSAAGRRKSSRGAAGRGGGGSESQLLLGCQGHREASWTHLCGEPLCSPRLEQGVAPQEPADGLPVVRALLEHGLGEEDALVRRGLVQEGRLVGRHGQGGRGRVGHGWAK